MEQVQTTLNKVARPTIDKRAITPPTAQAQRLSVLLVLATVAVALLLGWALKAAVQGRTAAYSDDQVSFRYPATWVTAQDDLGNAMVRNPNSASQVFNDRVLVSHDTAPKSGLPGGSPLADAATAWTLNRSQILDTFRNLATQDGLTVAGQPAIRVDYAYVADPQAALGRPGAPVVVRGSDVLFLVGDQLIVISGQADATQWAGFQPRFSKIVDTVALAQGGS